ncbi:relaxase domain-containing protein [Streptomyces sp. NPDC002559]
MEIAGIDQRLICWQSTRRQQIKDALSVLTADYEQRQGHPPGERAGYALACRAADRTRSPKRTVPRSLTELRDGWRESAIGAFGADVIDGLARRARAAAAAVWARVRPVVDVALVAVDVTAVVYVMRGAFKRHHLLAEARRHLAYALRGRPHQPGLDETIVQAAVDDYTRPAGRRMMTADLRALYPNDTEDQAVLRPLTRNHTAAPYERARLAAGAPAARVNAARRAARLGSRPGRTPLPCLPPRGRTRGRSAPARSPAVSWSRRPASTSTRWSRPAGPLKPPRSRPPSSRTVFASAPSPTAPSHSPPRPQPRSPVPSPHRSGPQEEELREYPGRTAQPRRRTRTRPCGPREDGRRARRGPGARAR